MAGFWTLMVTVNLMRGFTTIINVEGDERTTQIIVGDHQKLWADLLFNIWRGVWEIDTIFGNKQ
jgi:hypothetical protein